ncbi:MAG TPA: hypothetical protein VFE20_06825 [Thermoleophilia bacterium]|nr:hypothetical protein [Thermoleophilia bacterium]
MSVEGSLSDLRLKLKRVFARYYLDLCSPAIPDPSLAFDACRRYLDAWSESAEYGLVEGELSDEVEKLAGEIEQDLRQKHKGLGECFRDEPLDERFWEVVQRSRRGANR